MSTTRIVAAEIAEFSVAGVVTIPVPLNCSTPALVHRVAAAQFLAALTVAALAMPRGVLDDTDD